MTPKDNPPIKNKEVHALTKIEIERLGILVRRERKRLGLNQEAFAYKCNLSARIISEIEHCKAQPKLFTIGRIAVFLGVSFREIFDDGKLTPKPR